MATLSMIFTNRSWTESITSCSIYSKSVESEYGKFDGGNRRRSERGCFGRSHCRCTVRRGKRPNQNEEEGMQTRFGTTRCGKQQIHDFSERNNRDQGHFDGRTV